MNKKIILGNSDGILVDYDTKQKVIDWLYSKLDLSKYRYNILNNISKLKFLHDNEHYVSPNFKGYNYLLIMVKINDKNLCLAIDRKKLSYHKNQLDMKTIQIIQININTTEIMFNGTIYDGKIIKSNNQYVYLIQDCFYLMGSKMIDIEMNEKMNKLDIILKNNFKKDKISYCANFEFKLNKLYNYKELEELINNLSKLSVETNGLLFYPKISGVNILYLDLKKSDKVEIDSKNCEIIEQTSYNIIHNFVDFLKSRKYSYESNGKNKTYWLSRTIVPDVYDLSDSVNSEKIGIALIPNLKISQMCDDIIKENPIKFNCIFSTKFKKWIPLNAIENI
jgi:hypothetical protein